MSDYEQSLIKMMAVWNTEDADEKLALVDEAFEHNVHFVDPNHNIIGKEAFLAMVEQVQGQVPGAYYARNSDIQIQNNFCRYHWKIDLDGKRLMNGYDVTEVNDAGKIVKVIGFFGSLDADG